MKIKPELEKQISHIQGAAFDSCERSYNATDNSYEFVCSKCGCSLDISNDFEPTLWVDGKATVPSYCPNCGAEVVG